MAPVSGILINIGHADNLAPPKLPGILIKGKIPFQMQTPSANKPAGLFCDCDYTEEYFKCMTEHMLQRVHRGHYPAVCSVSPIAHVSLYAGEEAQQKQPNPHDKANQPSTQYVKPRKGDCNQHWSRQGSSQLQN